jgi:hypothetical protein
MLWAWLKVGVVGGVLLSGSHSNCLSLVPKKYSKHSVKKTNQGTVHRDTYNSRKIAIRHVHYIHHTQPFVSPNPRTSPAHLGPDVDIDVVIVVGVPIFRRPTLILVRLCVCTSSMLCASRFSILRRQS